MGSADFPFDGDHRAAYARIAWDGHAWQVEHRRVVYDHLRVVEEIRRSGFPLAEDSARRLVHARFIPQA